MNTRRGLEWMDNGRCAEVDPELFFPGVGENPNRAKAVCTSCEVKVQCLDYALTTFVESSTSNQGARPMDGVWGGTSVEERAVLRGKGRPSRPGFREQVLAKHDEVAAA